jgi:hypothetical protein
MIGRFNSRLETRTEFKGGPSPRIPDSLFLPTDRPCRHPLSQTTVVVNDMFGFQAYTRNYHLPRVVPFNVVGGHTIVSQPASRVTKLNRAQVTFRKGTPPSLSSQIPPVG